MCAELFGGRIIIKKWQLSNFCGKIKKIAQKGGINVMGLLGRIKEPNEEKQRAIQEKAEKREEKMRRLKIKTTAIFIDYLGGHPDFEVRKPTNVILRYSEDGSEILITNAFKKVLARFPKEDIVNLEMDRASKRSAGKAAAGAILGGVLTGGLGLLAGAAYGGRKRDDSIIVMTVKYGPANIEMYFKDPKDTKKKYGQVAGLLK